MTVQKINNTKMDKLKFKDFNLKIGRDKFSSMKLNKLLENNLEIDINYFKSIFDNDIDLSLCLRFKLRGILDNDKIIRIIKTKKEISNNCIVSSQDNLWEFKEKFYYRKK